MTYLLLLIGTAVWLCAQHHRAAREKAAEMASQALAERYHLSGGPIAPFSGGLRKL
jgi:hypothetical protein